jgi:hypothetical protein
MNKRLFFVLKDPLVNSIITDIVKTLINNPYTYAKIELRMMPALISILNNTSMTGEKKDISSLISVIIKARTNLNRTF